ncbi:DNA mismatch repair endonuclease MutL [Thermodesulforhabdus norvegica]|uniref:DNA mismatch repair protein MutL n=1 Tax=Thermodesulforhabdus norvegica TaxID=39841 RepID=A0A1I4VYB8_9BACT|nr:DNA mismatch repair endonuclease MutL [Thermodesulforhabdus norvegica]SFN06175.1 DNA mismatch repair protein MutL [Thermodesulforhabdus norvegica]
MGKIRILPDVLCNKIAAGEVIERPAAVVKELVENSIDAGADNITVIIEGGGKKLVEVTDNGEGMDREDALLALERHATSKISSPDDLYRIGTLGFRGEALASIAAVSRLRMVTRSRGEELGTEVFVEGGTIREVNDTGCPVGCRVTVRDLFFNLPARKRFLKAETTERYHIVDFLQRIALAYPGIHFRLCQGSKIVFDYPKTGDLSRRVGQVLGWDIAEKLVYFSGERDGYRFQGFISPPELTFPSWKHLYLFVNGRSVRDSTLSRIIRDGFSGYIPADEYPAAVIFLEVPAELVDVNVHPTKREVRFREPSRINGLLGDEIRSALSRIDLARRSLPGKKFTSSSVYCAEQSLNTLLKPREVERDLKLEERITRWTDNPDFFARLQYLCQIDGTYLACRDEKGIVIIDVHAAHERILYNRLSRTSFPLMSQRLVRPILVELSAEETERLEDRCETLKVLGYDVDKLDMSAAMIRSVPAILPPCRHDAVVKDLIKTLDHGLGISELVDLFVKTVACHNAIRGAAYLREEEIKWLLTEMDREMEVLTCPHGRPTWIRLTRQEVDRLFKRT